MLHIEKWKIVLSLILTVLGIAYAVPNALPQAQRNWMEQHMPSWMPHKTVNLGLDLRGGSHLLLQADTRAVIAEHMSTMADGARKDLREAGIGYTDMSANASGISLRLRDPATRDAAYKILHKIDDRADVNIASDGGVTVTVGDKEMSDIKAQILNQSIEIVRRRVDESGTKEPLIQRQGDDRIVVQLPGVDDPEQIKALIGKTAKMTFQLVDETAGFAGPVSPSSVRLPMRERPGTTVAVNKRVMVSGEMLLDAQPSFDQQGTPVVSFRFDALGSKRFCDVTRDNVGKPFGIVLDNVVISAPVIRDAICGGRGQISCNFTVEEANQLALLLRAGALPAPLNVIEERSVGPTLGSDSVEMGKKATAYALIAIVILMVLYYGLFGMFANVALLLNMCFLFALLSILQATLTLPGIAGIILTIGMAVDTNVLIYERIREEIRHGRTVLSAIDTGYRQAMSTVVDANVTTLIVALILFSFGTGPVKGFAVSMSLGIITSMFSAIMLTRLMVITWLRKTRPATLDL